MPEYDDTTATGEGESQTVGQTDDDILQASRDGLKARIDAEQEQRVLMMDDLRFATLDQWPAELRNARERDPNGARPCLTVDQINQYLTQVSNENIKNRRAVKPRPVDDRADPETAKIYAGIIRHIEDQSSAKIAYGTAGESQSCIGLGFIRIVTDYVDDVSFDQEIIVKRVPDTFCVYLGAHTMPDGRDADEAWVFEKMPIAQFNREYPKAKYADADFSGLGVVPAWKTDSEIIVCEYFYRKYRAAEILFLADGSTVDAADYDDIPEPRLEITGRRTVQRSTLHWCKHTGCEILEKRELKGKYIPVVEVVGKEKIVDGRRVLWGLVRPAKDALRALNYWVSALMEKMALSPKAPFVGAVGQFASQGDKWDKANVTNFSKLEYDPIDVSGNAVPPPRRQEPMQMEPAMVGMISMMQNFVKSALGMYKAALGDTESQQSGRAILALQKESDTATMHFGENLAISIEHVGRIIVDMIPHYYDTRRVVRILGEDGKEGTVEIDPAQQEAVREIRDLNGRAVKRIYNLGIGKYDVTVTTGPSYATNRQEAATVMTELANTAKDPVSAAIMRYGAIKNSDFAGSEEIMKMLKAMLPAQLQQPDDAGEEIPAAAMQKIAQLGQGVQVLQQKLQEIGAENQELKAAVAVDMAKVNADHDAKMRELALDKAVADEKARLARDEFEFQKQLDIERLNHELDLDERRAAAANKIAADKLAFDQSCRQQDQAAKEAEQTPKTDFTPQLIEVIAQGFESIKPTMEAMLQATLNPPPRQVSIGGVQKDASGMITGAQVVTKPTLQ